MEIASINSWPICGGSFLKLGVVLWCSPETMTSSWKPQQQQQTANSGKTAILTLYSAKAIVVPRRIIWSWYTGRWWVGCYIWYSEEGTGRGRSSPRPFLAVPDVTASPSTASVPITVLLYNGPLLCGYNVHIKGLMCVIWSRNALVQ